MSESGFFKLTPSQLRICLMFFLGLIFFSVLLFQLWNMQIYHQDRYQDKALKQSVRRIRVPAVRGRILASDGTPIVANRASYNVKFHLAEMLMSKQSDTIRNVIDNAERIAKAIGRVNPLTKDVVFRHMNYYPGIPLDVFDDLSEIEKGKLSEMLPPVKGLDITEEPVRDYPYGSLCAQLLGYVAQDNPKKAGDRAEYFYYISDLVGKSGLELAYNEKLRGQAGSQLVMVDSRGFVHEQLESPVMPKNGYDVQLTIDLRAQQIAEELIRGYNAAIIVMNSATGAVTVMASSPAYNPAEFVPKISFARYRELNSDPRMPFLNRATMGSYMPGSIIKPLVGLALLENGVDPNEKVYCDGLTKHGYGNGIHCSSRYGHGSVDLYDAIKRSCNVYFVNNAVKIGIDPLSAMFASAGLGKKTGIEISEQAGLLPKNSRTWNERETAYVGFGQGKIAITPLQGACFYAAIANGGTLWKPYLVDRIFDQDSNNSKLCIYDALPAKNGHIAASRESIEEIRQGMFLVVNEKGGSGTAAATPKTVIYGKTGTADVIRPNETPWKVVWFAGFAKNPDTGLTYSIIVMVEHGVSGGSTAAPIAGKFFDQWIQTNTVPPENEAEL